MARFMSINNLNQKYGNREINNAIASNVLPITLQSGPENLFNLQNFSNPNHLNNPIDQTNVGNLPISITAAQRETVVDPYNGLSRMTAAGAAHQSRFGQIIYQNGDPRSKIKNVVGTPRQTQPGLLACLLPGVLILFLLIFVLSCIYKHNKYPFSANGLRYYLEHPDEIKDPKTAVAVMVARMDQRNLENIQIDKYNTELHPGEGGDSLPLPISPQLLANNSQLPVSYGICRQGLHYLNGLCYPCKIGHWDGSKCTTEPIQQIKKAVIIKQSIINNTTNKTPINQTQQKTKQDQLHNFNKDFINTLNSGDTSTPNNSTSSVKTKCKENEFLVNGKCVACPNGLVWNGKLCQRRNSESNDRRYHYKHISHKRRS